MGKLAFCLCNKRKSWRFRNQKDGEIKSKSREAKHGSEGEFVKRFWKKYLEHWPSWRQHAGNNWMLQLILSHFSYTEQRRFQITHDLTKSPAGRFWMLVAPPELLMDASYSICLNAKEKKEMKKDSKIQIKYRNRNSKMIAFRCSMKCMNIPHFWRLPLSLMLHWHLSCTADLFHIQTELLPYSDAAQSKVTVWSSLVSSRSGLQLSRCLTNPAGAHWSIENKANLSTSLWKEKKTTNNRTKVKMFYLFIYIFLGNRDLIISLMLLNHF